VFDEAGDGSGAFTQRAFMGAPEGTVPPDSLREDAPGHTGDTAIEARVDLTQYDWAGYMFLTGALPAGETTPVADFGMHDAGHDLTGATRLTWWARGEQGGETVEFGTAGLGYSEEGIPEAPYPDSSPRIAMPVLLTAEWQQFSLDLDGLDLSRIACGFEWVAAGWANPGAEEVVFFVDEVRFEFDSPRLNPMLLRSYAPAAVDSPDAFINGFAYTYDNAAAAIALSQAGLHDRARQIADALTWVQRHDRAFTDGRIRNAYAAGGPASAPGWFSAAGEPFARMPGFWDADAGTWFEDFYADSTSTGNMAWTILALLDVYRHAPDRADYLQAARDLGDLVLTLKSATGFTGGWEGFDDAQTQVTYASTEHNVDLVAAFEGLAAACAGDPAASEAYAAGAEHARAFVRTMADQAGPFYATGTLADSATPNREVVPLDAQTWTVLALGPAGLPGGADGARALMDQVGTEFGVDCGVDFNTDRDGIWLEGTAQMAVVWTVLGEGARRAEAVACLDAHALPDGSLPAADHDGLTTGFMVSGIDQPWLYPHRAHLGATAWAAFALLEVNPLNPDGVV
jgi:hypothetical protein